eukprot:152754-Chlamydomonas_euryale.AAC.13
MSPGPDRPPCEACTGWAVAFEWCGGFSNVWTSFWKHARREQVDFRAAATRKCSLLLSTLPGCSADTSRAYYVLVDGRHIHRISHLPCAILQTWRTMQRQVCRG